MIPRTAITLKLERRPQDGGLRVYSDDVPGLVLSGPDPDKVMADVMPALRGLGAWYTVA